MPKYIEHSQALAGGNVGTRYVLSHMARLAVRDSKDNVVRTIAAQIRRNCKAFKTLEEKEYCELFAAYKYVSDNVKYIYDPADREHVTAPKFLLTTHKYGDCDCMSTAFSSILIALGYTNQSKVIKADKKTEEYSHVYNVVFVPSINSWIPVDTILPQVKSKNGFGNEKTGTPDERYFFVWGVK